jgi:hypothetical protein
MKNGQDAALEPIRTIAFVFSMSSFLANGFSTLRRESSLRPWVNRLGALGDAQELLALHDEMRQAAGG